MMYLSIFSRFRPNKNEKINMAKSIVNTFPILKSSEGDGYVSNLCKCMFLCVVVKHIVAKASVVNARQWLSVERMPRSQTSPE